MRVGNHAGISNTHLLPFQNPYRDFVSSESHNRVKGNLDDQFRAKPFALLQDDAIS